MSTWTVKLLGEFQIKDSTNVTKSLTTPEAIRLLAYLLYFHQQTHPCVKLAEILWPDVSLEERRQRLQIALNALSQEFFTAKEPVIICQGNKLKLNIRHFDVDILNVKTLIQQANHCSTPQQKLIYLQQVIQQDYGIFLSQFEDNWILSERQHLHTLYLAVLHQLFKVCLQLRKLSAATAYAHLAVSTEPYSERTHLDLIKVYVARGYYASAKQQYEELKHIFNQELKRPVSKFSTDLVQKLGLHQTTVVVTH